MKRHLTISLVPPQDQAIRLWSFLSLVLFAQLAKASVDPPTDIILDKSNIDEHCPIETLIGNFTAVDPDGGTHFWSLEAGPGATGNMSFKINIGSSSLLSDEIFDFETQSSYSIYVQVRDENNATFGKTFIITINDIDEGDLMTDMDLSPATINEGNSIGDAVGTLTTTGVHAGTNHTYTFISGEGATDNGSFTILGDQLLSDEVFDYQTKNSYSVRLRSESQEGDVFVKIHTIDVLRVNNSPTDLALSDNSFEETR